MNFPVTSGCDFLEVDDWGLRPRRPSKLALSNTSLHTDDTDTDLGFFSTVTRQWMTTMVLLSIER